MKSSFVTIASVVLFAAGLLQARPSGTIDGTQARIDATKGILRQVEQQAADAADQADRLDHYSLDLRVSRESHIEAVNQLSYDINQIGKEVAELESSEASLAPWERDALYTALPLLKDAASFTNDEIRILHENAPFLWSTKAYQTDAERIQADCSGAAREISSRLKLVNNEKRLRLNSVQEDK